MILPTGSMVALSALTRLTTRLEQVVVLSVVVAVVAVALVAVAAVVASSAMITMAVTTAAMAVAMVATTAVKSHTLIKAKAKAHTAVVNHTVVKAATVVLKAPATASSRVVTKCLQYHESYGQVIKVWR